MCRLTTNHTTPMADTAPGVSLPPTRSSRLCSDCYEPVPYVTVRPLDRTSLSHDCPLPTCSTDRTCMDFLECRRLARSHRATNAARQKTVERRECPRHYSCPLADHHQQIHIASKIFGDIHRSRASCSCSNKASRSRRTTDELLQSRWRSTSSLLPETGTVPGFVSRLLGSPRPITVTALAAVTSTSSSTAEVRL